MKRIIALLVAAFVAFLPMGASAQETPDATFDIILPSAPDGFAGGIVQVELMQGTSGKFGDINCNGNLDFNDVVRIFASIAGVGLEDCRVAGNVFEITGVMIPDFGINEVISQDADSIVFSTADLTEMLQPGATDSLIATVEFASLAVNGGSAGIYVRWIRFDDDNGNTVEMPDIKGVVN